MSDIEQDLREAHPNSAQRWAGSNILLEAADEIARLRRLLKEAEKAMPRDLRAHAGLRRRISEALSTKEREKT